MIPTSDCVGIILAGGTGSRLHPCTKVTNKHLLPIGEMPMIFYPLKKLVGAGITDILIVTGTEHMGDFISLLGSGKDFGCRLTYRVQDEAGGIAQALALAERFANGQPMCVILGDNIFEDSINGTIAEFMKEPTISHNILTEVTDNERFGVAADDCKRITKIIAKPAATPSHFAATRMDGYPGAVIELTKGITTEELTEL